MKKSLELLIGRDSNPWMVTVMLIAPTLFTVFILFSYSFSWNTVITAVLAFDIFAGLISNAREETHTAWKELPKKSLILFVAFHLTVYPLFVILFQVDMWLMIFMLGMLFAKTSFFMIGTGLFVTKN
ncbi:MAG: hypothetical protein KKH01_07800 [Firmicutes bacterium]|nr:hypothetical protein [Bacillota bacterium]